jgi:hypothetical protein
MAFWLSFFPFFEAKEAISILRYIFLYCTDDASDKCVFLPISKVYTRLSVEKDALTGVMRQVFSPAGGILFDLRIKMEMGAVERPTLLLDPQIKSLPSTNGAPPVTGHVKVDSTAPASEKSSVQSTNSARDDINVKKDVLASRIEDRLNALR